MQTKPIFQKIRRTLSWVAAAALALAAVPAQTALAAPGETTTYKAPTYNNAESTQGLGSLWVYEYMIEKDMNFKPMVEGEGIVLYKSGQGVSAGEEATLVSPWNTDLYLTTGVALVEGAYKGITNSQTFVAPVDGAVTIDACTIKRNYGNKGTDGWTAEYAVYLNNTKLWPEGDNWAAVGNDQDNKQDVPELKDIQVTKGDKIRFLVANGLGGAYEDATQWYATIKLAEPAPTTTTTATPDTTTTQADATTTTQADTTTTTKAPITTLPDITGITPTEYKSPYYKSEEGMPGIDTIWIYEYSLDKETAFKPMIKGDDGLYKSDVAGEEVYQAGLVAPWNTDLYLEPGYIGNQRINASQTFVAPRDGVVAVDPSVILRNAGNADDEGYCNECAVFLNETKIWPAGDAWAKTSGENKTDVEELKNLVMRKGDKLRFVVSCGFDDKENGQSWKDYTRWNVNVKLYGVSLEGGGNPSTGSGAAPVAAAGTLLIAAAALAFTLGKKHSR